MHSVNEKSTAWLTVELKDRNGVAQAPTSLSYRIDNVADGAEIRADTPITPAATVVITLTPADNTMQATTKSTERHRVTVVADYGVDDDHNDEYVYTVRNLKGVA